MEAGVPPGYICGMPTQATILARRFGYGPAGAQGDSAEALVAGLRGDDVMQQQFPMTSREELARLRTSLAEAARAKGDRQGRKKAGADLAEVEERALVVSMARIVASETPFRERLAWFWQDHFTVVSRKRRSEGQPVDFLETAMRPHLAGRFADMLKAATTHPAMIQYLDQDTSVGPSSEAARNGKRGLNENLAREVLELHTMGVGGGYSQADVREFAELLTGLVAADDAGRGFRQGMAEPGPETVLGREYGIDSEGLKAIRAALDDLARHPDTARHLARKLAVHFIQDDPPADMVDTMAAAYADNDTALIPVYQAMLAHPAALAPAPQKARQPFDFLGAALRALQVPADRLVGLNRQVSRGVLRRPLALMGQPFLSPAGPDGWAEDTSAWLTPQGLAGRIAWAMRVPQRLLERLPDPEDFAQVALGDDIADSVSFAARRAPTRAEGVGVVLASPGFNLR
jgi:uncharacterized protein (DUF1800 family)